MRVSWGITSSRKTCTQAPNNPPVKILRTPFRQDRSRVAASNHESEREWIGSCFGGLLSLVPFPSAKGIALACCGQSGGRGCREVSVLLCCHGGLTLRMEFKRIKRDSCVALPIPSVDWSVVRSHEDLCKARHSGQCFLYSSRVLLTVPLTIVPSPFPSLLSCTPLSSLVYLPRGRLPVSPVYGRPWLVSDWRRSMYRLQAFPPLPATARCASWISRYTGRLSFPFVCRGCVVVI